MTLKENHIKYLRSLVRMDIRKKEKNLNKIQQRPAQSEGDFNSFVEKLKSNLHFRRDVLKELGGEKEDDS